MTMVGEVHVVPSGKVYRQIFDAEVQLVRSLGEARSRAINYGRPIHGGKIPMVEGLETRACGHLSYRQQTWIESMPNDGFTENPILYREAMTYAIQKIQETETEIAAREVRGLADIIVPERSDRDIVQHVAQQRRYRHEEAITDLQRELVNISKEMEPLVLMVGKELQKKLTISDGNSQLLFQTIEGDADLATVSLKDFKELWSSITQESFCRRKMIKETCRTLTKLEEKRAKQIGAVLKRYTASLEKICYLMPAEVYRFIHKEAMMINQAILANRRGITKLTVNLMEADLKQEVAHRLRWQDRLQEWKLLWRNNTIHKFRSFMESEQIQNPGGVQRVLELMVKEQEALNEERIQQLHSVSELLPPKCTKSQVADWYSCLETLNKKIDCLNVHFLNLLRVQHEKVGQMCLAELQKMKVLLMDMKVCTKEEAEKIVSSDCFPLVGELQRQFERELELMDRSLERLAKQTNLQSKGLFKFTQGAVHLWDVLEIGLCRHEKGLQKKLDDCRQKHDGENQVKEANLDIFLDKLRQESSQEGLKICMANALATLEGIRAGYEMFHHDQVEIVTSYPTSILSELKSYSASLSQYFGVKEVFKETLTLQSEDQEEELCATDIKLTESNAEETALALPETEHQLLSDVSEIIMSDIEEESSQLQFDPQSTIGVLAPAILMDPSPQESKIKADSGEALSSHSGFQQTEQHDGIMAAMSETVDQLPREEEQDGHEVLSELAVTAKTFGEDHEGGEVPVEMTESPEEAEVLKKCKTPPDSFITSNGNIYTLLPSGDMDPKEEAIGLLVAVEHPKMSQVFMTEVQTEDFPPVYLKHVVVPESIFKMLKERIRLSFYEHLEIWFDEALANSESVVSAKNDELKSELELRLHLHQPRSQRIEKDIHNVRAAELLLHIDRAERHCDGVLEALAKLKNSSIMLRDEMKRKTKEFSKRITGMESSFMNANKSEKLAVLTKSLFKDRDKHIESIKISMRKYRQNLEGTLGMLRDSNAEFIKSFRLFAEGGNFSPDEIQTFRTNLEKVAGRIDGSEGFIMVDLEGVESKCIEQVKEVVRKFEARFHSLTADMIFLENIQRLLSNLHVKIKSEVAKSNLQTEKLQAQLEILRKKIDACARPNMDKEVVTPEDLRDFMKSVVEDMIQRSNYLKCLLDQGLVPEKPPLQGPIATAARQESKVTFAEMDSLLQPCKIGKPPYDDAVVSLVRNLTHTQHPNKQVNRHIENQTSITIPRQLTALMPQPPTSPTDARENALSIAPQRDASAGEKSKQGGRRSSISGTRRSTKLHRADKSFQVFGEKPEESHDFKGILNTLFWKTSDTILKSAEEFYKKKEKRSIVRSEFLQETYEECAEMLVQKLLSYESQGEEYHNACLHEFREQLEECEGLLAQVPPLLMDDLRKLHVDQLHAEIEDIYANFSERMRELDAAKEKNTDLLRPSLGHPDCHQELMALCQQEEQRQRELRTEISANTRNLQDCAAQSADNFVTALATLAEILLLEFDGSLNVDDVQAAKTEVVKEKLFTLIRRRQSGLPMDDVTYKPLIERRGRVWLGVRRIEVVRTTPTAESADQVTTSATTIKTSVSLLEVSGSQNTTTKTSMSNVSVAEERDHQHTTSVTSAKTSSAQISVVRDSQDSIAKTSMSHVSVAEEREHQHTTSVTAAKTSSAQISVVKGSQASIAKTSISRITLEEPKEDQYTPSVTTAKSSLAHMSVVDARGAAYMEYRLSLDQEMTRIADVAASQLSEAERWEKWWQQAVLEIKQLYG